jgi:bacitracin synthase 3
VAQLAWKLTVTTTLPDITAAVANLQSAHSILRTRFVIMGSEIFQICLKETSSPIEITDALEPYCSENLHRGFGFPDETWFRVGVITQENSVKFVVLTIHHALYDGWSRSRIVHDLFASLFGSPIKESVPFKNAVDYICSYDKAAAKKFWNDYLDGVELGTPLKIERPQSGFTDLNPVVKFESTIRMSDLHRIGKLVGVTTATIVKAAWSLTLSMYMQVNDIVIGNVTSGRDIPVKGVQE